MDVKEKGEALLKQYRKIEGDLYHQIERVDHSINVLKLRKSDGSLKKGKSENGVFFNLVGAVLFGLVIASGVATANPAMIGFGIGTSVLNGALGARNIATIVSSKKDMGKVNETISKLYDYKRELDGHAHFMGIKISALEKELKKPNATTQSLEDLSQKLYYGKKSISMSDAVKQEVAQYGIKFDSKDEVALTPDYKKTVDAAISQSEDATIEQ